MRKLEPPLARRTIATDDPSTIFRCIFLVCSTALIQIRSLRGRMPTPFHCTYEDSFLVFAISRFWIPLQTPIRMRLACAATAGECVNLLRNAQVSMWDMGITGCPNCPIENTPLWSALCGGLQACPKQLGQCLDTISACPDLHTQGSRDCELRTLAVSDLT